MVTSVERAEAAASPRLTGDAPLEGNGDFSIGGALWPGVSKLIEEAGEVQQVCGKLLGSRGVAAHWDGSDLRERLQDEIADVIAACVFVAEENSLGLATINRRVGDKLSLFRKWHASSEAPTLSPNEVSAGNPATDEQINQHPTEGA